MRILKDLYFYPWLSMQENNANTVLIDGPVPTLIDPGHAHLFNNVAGAAARDGVDMGRVKLILFTHGHPDHIEATDLFEEGVLRGIGKEEYMYMRQEGKGSAVLQVAEDALKLARSGAGPERQNPGHGHRRQAVRESSQRSRRAAVGPLQVVKTDQKWRLSRRALEQTLKILQYPVPLLGQGTRVRELSPVQDRVRPVEQRRHQGR